ncbi:MAG: 6,7-dimethyl-8-ribityllumazine synthase [Chitinivibrionales bacterium]|nr:6,7-dimethyl-8-ribityllumazine synthase [Chitinivibrionales bacterium]MBD3396995.1 6,7-dimethyl-8-ribityllumazine synthase [Chitinivibrionales bacterium]
MSTVIEGMLNASGKRFALVASRYNELITRKLLEGAIDCLVRHQVQQDTMTIVWVPGAFEMPLVAKKLAVSGQYDAVICLGAVIRGTTPHFDYVAAEVAKGLAAAGLETGTPITFGVLTTDTVEQAVERAGTTSGNRGFDAAQNAIEMADLVSKL